MDPRPVLILFILATSVVGDFPPGPPSSFEKFFDNIIRAVLQKKHDLIEPYHIEDLEITVQPHLRRLKLPPKIQIHAGNNTLYGLSTIHRSGHAGVRVEMGSRFTSAQMASGPLRITSSLTISLPLGLKMRPTIEISISNLDFSIEILGKKTTQLLKTTSFKINELKDLRVTLRQWKWTDPVENRIINRILPLLEHKIRTEAEDTLKGHLDDKLRGLPDELKSLLYG